MKNEDFQSNKIEIVVEKHFLMKTLRDMVVNDVDEITVMKREKIDRSELIMAHGDTCALITIRDTGIGIKSENLKRIFNPFYTTAVQGGTGLGLSMVKKNDQCP